MNREETAEELRTEEELKQFASDLKAGRIFTSAMVPDPRDLPFVFTPFMLMDKQAREELKCKVETDEVVLFYEELSKALSRPDDELPVFGSVQTLSLEELDVVKKIIGDLKQKIPKEPQLE